jgi:hypothetical protein
MVDAVKLMIKQVARQSAPAPPEWLASPNRPEAQKALVQRILELEKLEQHYGERYPEIRQKLSSLQQYEKFFEDWSGRRDSQNRRSMPEPDSLQLRHFSEVYRQNERAAAEAASDLRLLTTLASTPENSVAMTGYS